MKTVIKLISLITVIVTVISMTACTDDSKKSTTVNNTKTVDDILNSGGKTTDTVARSAPDGTLVSPSPKASKVDVDLTQMNSTMVYSEVYSMLTQPELYLGKSVRMNGAFSVYEGEDMVYFAVLISDATACCSQGIEFVLANDSEMKYPDNYPAIGTTVTVSGTFGTYMEGNNRYCRLSDAVFE